jgi:hypothetical protein
MVIPIPDDVKASCVAGDQTTPHQQAEGVAQALGVPVGDAER